MVAATNISSERFNEGLTIDEYIYGMQKNKETFRENYNGFSPRAEDLATLRDMAELNVLVLLEDWCGDVSRYVPALVKLAEFVKTWNVRIFYRDANLDLSDQWLKEGKYRAIPVVVFFDKGMNEVACYVEKPVVVYSAEQEGRDAFAAEHPELTDAALPYDDMGEATRDLYASFIRQFRADKRGLWQQYFVDEIVQKLQNAGEQQIIKEASV